MGARRKRKSASRVTLQDFGISLYNLYMVLFWGLWYNRCHRSFFCFVQMFGAGRRIGRRRLFIFWGNYSLRVKFEENVSKHILFLLRKKFFCIFIM